MTGRKHCVWCHKPPLPDAAFCSWRHYRRDMLGQGPHKDELLQCARYGCEESVWPGSKFCSEKHERWVATDYSRPPQGFNIKWSPVWVRGEIYADHLVEYFHHKTWLTLLTVSYLTNRQHWGLLFEKKKIFWEDRWMNPVPTHWHYRDYTQLPLQKRLSARRRQQLTKRKHIRKQQRTKRQRHLTRLSERPKYTEYPIETGLDHFNRIFETRFHDTHGRTNLNKYNRQQYDYVWQPHSYDDMILHEQHKNRDIQNRTQMEAHLL